ncbi:DEAD/DEAH box helicase [Turicibacter sanguinis]|uniref:DEAD/DEAH box helicase n=2 Tax=Turicibacter sanguinis TaxID=154288 RepID=A0A9X5ANY6_9FIRM|nr:DEAD/DEAH box helicase family protein [Turicibacter sanguinis]EFF63356.1 DEAD/DEAH box helicase [Turicibacter sanguinis PC909]MTK20941.1 DEAD/DEAH box helicase [Turicibacter sanguinis]MTK73552.1 DEAD/DEAH box helicase [Turicibacter sanguinis]
MGLKELELQLQYRSEEDDILNDFYKKVIRDAVDYKRAVGYFSTHSLLLLGDELDEFMRKGAKMKLIASPNLSDEDIETIKKGYENRTKIITSCIINSLEIPDNEQEKENLSKIECMIAKGNLDIKIAFRNTKGIFHEKIGIITDEDNEKIAFNGSMNETFNGYCDNFESIDLYFSWDSRDLIRINSKENNFDKLWDNQTKNLDVYDFTEVIQKRLIQLKENGVLPIIQEELPNYDIHPSGPCIPHWLQNGIRPYQLEAYQKWVINDYKGILQMATGTGKTITACYSLVKHYEMLIKQDLKQIVVILAPYKHLVDQWYDELIKFGYSPFKAYSDIANWDKIIQRQARRLNLDPKRKHLSIVTTNDSFKTTKFQVLLSELKKRHEVVFIADEAHNLGAESTLSYLSTDFKYRLGLTATPIRHNDELGTEKLIQYFNGIIFKYDLEEAIKNGFLTKYIYHPIVVYLDSSESNKFYDILNEFQGYSLSQLRQFSFSNNNFKEKIKLTYQIADGSINKFKAFKEKINEFKDTYYNLIYCSSVKINDGESKLPIKQIEALNVYMGKELNMKVHTFTAQEDIYTRRELIERFASGSDIQGLVAIKCLDEGVDVPATRRAFILSSTTNEKQFIQRRGRILRNSPGKDYAEIFDFVTLPRELQKVLSHGPESEAEVYLIMKEYNRILEFARLAINPELGLNLANDIYKAYRLNQYIENTN